MIDHANTPHTGWVDRYNARVQAFWQGRPRPLPGGTARIPRLSDEQYDDLLSRNVVFLELFDCSAKTIVVECMAHNTPVVANRHPALEEYLGRAYPLFYERFDDAFLERVSSALNSVAPLK